jgi:hypothetical protein
MEPKSVVDQLGDLNPEAYFFDNMASALVGLGYIGHRDPVAVYSRAKIYEKLAADGLSAEDVEEYFSSKFVGLWAGEHTPVILDDLTE